MNVPLRSYRDVLATRERRRPDGRSVWPLTDADLPSRTAPRGSHDAAIAALLDKLGGIE